MAPTNPHKEYIQSRAAAATPVELTRMLFEGAVQAMQNALASHRSGDILARGNAVTKAVQILGELRFSLRRDVAPQYCDTLSGLYGYMQNRLIQAHAEKSESMLREVLQLTETLLEGWIGAMQNLSALDAATAKSPETVPAEALAPAFSGVSNPYVSKAAPMEPLNRSWEF
jgi:flagellar protein FliS